MQRIIVIPAVFIGCLIVIWVGTMAASNMPPQGLLAPTQTAFAEESQAAEPHVEPDSKALASETQSCTLPASYPDKIQQWCSPIESAAAETGLPPSLIAAVILQESGGDPSAISHSGAVGLMQVMPRDGKAADFMCINGPCFASRPSTEELLEPAFNVRYGSQYLSELSLKHGSYREALFKYGPLDMGYRYADLVLNIWEQYQ